MTSRAITALRGSELPQISWASVDQRHSKNVLLIGAGCFIGFDTHIRLYYQVYYFR